jgi:DNA helicase II / ATP-dependent DNA helicase PcrA
MHSNNVIFAAAGSGKTTLIVKEALKNKTGKILITTFTIKNSNEIKRKFINLHGYIPENITIKTWYNFLLTDFIRPYQTNAFSNLKVSSIFYPDKPNKTYYNKTDRRYFLNSGNQVNKDRVSDLAFICNEKSGGNAINRIEEVYETIYIDEVQDMAGWDLEIFRLLMNANIKLTFIGDIRQATYSTSNERKNKKYRGSNIYNFFKELEKLQLCTIDKTLNISHRCNQSICDLADNLYPHLEKTRSLNNDEVEHQGLFIVREKDFDNYIQLYSPQVLRYNAKTKIKNAMNFGESKGLTFDRVLIKPTKAMEQYLESGVNNLPPETLAKLYVAITRARHSVAFISKIKRNSIGLQVFNQI